MQATFLVTAEIPDGVSREALAEEILDILQDGDFPILSVRPWAQHNQEASPLTPLAEDPNQGFLPLL